MKFDHLNTFCFHLINLLWYKIEVRTSFILSTSNTHTIKAFCSFQLQIGQVIYTKIHIYQEGLNLFPFIWTKPDPSRAIPSQTANNPDLLFVGSHY